MTRHQRRKAQAARKVAKSNANIVRDNLSNPIEVVRIRGAQVSTVYDNRMDRARGRGATPIHRQVTKVISRVPVGWNPNA